ncbi:hypothetical protein [endosymbiont DhMRE of Dentiscutata heterogama]|uniref:hypothetical protein n=1 Tax=endosymbiont DhMRE of Dentiscutata heterogama TaxID=1609546 RepID=UPI002AD3E48E|nr:hypothetical protein [endosymbiont DhMRE of Dentiscutata heterogama]
MSNLLAWTKKILINLGTFLKAFIYPLATCFFAILNYIKIEQILTDNNHHNWATFALILSVVYILFTLGFGAYWIYLAIKNPPPYL